MAEENETFENNQDKIAELENKICDLETQLSESKAESTENFDKYLRGEADFQNLKKRTEKEKEDTRKYALQETITGILTVLDNFERGIKVYKELDSESLNRNEVIKGMELIYKELKDVLSSRGLCEIDCIGKEFDPYYHEALATICSDEADEDTVVEEFQKGYILNDRVIRPSRVKVNKKEPIY